MTEPVELAVKLSDIGEFVETITRMQKQIKYLQLTCELHSAILKDHVYPDEDIST